MATKSKRTSDVDAFLAAFEHRRREEVRALRAAILQAHPTLTERIKWNAPSFCHADDDRVTFRFAPKRDTVQLIFHRGAKAKSSAGFHFDDPCGLLSWAAVDRGVVTLESDDDFARHGAAIVRLVGAWIEATRE